MQMPQMGYDRAITVFSPDGRLFQVEYAREAVKRGATAIGVKTTDGVVLIADRRVASRLLEADAIEKIFKIDEHVCAATSGLVADARALVDRARIESQINWLTYDESISVKELAKKICDFKQQFTQFGGVRPFGVSLLVAGIDDKSHLYETDPSGALLEYKATATGAGRTVVLEHLENHYKEDMALDDAIKMSLIALGKAIEGELTPETVEIGMVKMEDKKFQELTIEESKPYVEQANEELKKELGK